MKEDRRIVRTRSAIKNAFFELADEKPIERITVREICNRANINRTSFYDHYVDYPAFLRALEAQIADDMLAQFNGVLQKAEPPVVSLRRYLHFLKTSTYSKYLFSDVGRNAAIKFFESALKEILFQHWLEQNKTTLDQANYLYQYIINGGFGVIRLWYENGCLQSVEEMAELLIRVHINGLSSFSVLSYAQTYERDDVYKRNNS